MPFFVSNLRKNMDKQKELLKKLRSLIVEIRETREFNDNIEAKYLWGSLSKRRKLTARNQLSQCIDRVEHIIPWVEAEIAEGEGNAGKE
jgi:hypothetical protein